MSKSEFFAMKKPRIKAVLGSLGVVFFVLFSYSLEMRTGSFDFNLRTGEIRYTKYFYNFFPYKVEYQKTIISDILDSEEVYFRGPEWELISYSTNGSSRAFHTFYGNISSSFRDIEYIIEWKGYLNDEFPENEKKALARKFLEICQKHGYSEARKYISDIYSRLLDRLHPEMDSDNPE